MIDDPSDTVLVERAARGGEYAFRALYRRHVRPVYWIAHGLLGSPSEAEDVTQETFVTAWRKLGGLQLAGESLLPWLATICRFHSGTADDATEREVAVTAELSIEVASTGEAAERVREIAAAHDGWIERLSVGTSGEADPATSEGMPGDGTEPSVTGIEPYPSPGADEATLRVPADHLDAVLADLGTLGEVQRTLVTRDDVTAHAVDLRARVSAAETSIARLTELMGEAASVADLLEVETQLAARQAELESARSELEAVEGRVAMSTVIVRFLTEPAPAEVEPSSPFVDGLLSGWNTLVAALGGMVAALGFLLPWLAPLGLIVLIVWAIRRRRTRTRKSAS